MSAPKLRRWICPDCGSGVHAPSQPRRDDVRRFCLDCSKRTGRLVERTCPALDKSRTESKEQRAAAAKARRATAAKQRAKLDAERKSKLDAHFRVTHPVTRETVDMRREVAKVWKAARKVEPHLRERPPKLIASRGSGSYAYTHSGEIHLGSGASWSTLVHEVAHFVRARQVTTYRSDGKRAVHDRAFYMVLKDLVERLVPGLIVSFYGVTSWGYNVDGVIRQQLYALGEQKAAGS